MRIRFLNLLTLLAPTFVLMSCTTWQVAKNPSIPKSNVENRGIASTGVIAEKITCFPNRGPAMGYEFYPPSTPLDFSAVVLTSEDPIREHLLSLSTKSVKAESTMKMVLTNSGEQFFGITGRNLSFRTNQISYSLAKPHSFNTSPVAMIQLPTGLRLTLRSEKVATPQGQFALTGSLTTDNYEMNLLCNF